MYFKVVFISDKEILFQIWHSNSTKVDTLALLVCRLKLPVSLVYTVSKSMHYRITPFYLIVDENMRLLSNSDLLIPSSSCCLPYIEGVWIVHCMHCIGSQLMISMMVCSYNYILRVLNFAFLYKTAEISNVSICKN